MGAARPATATGELDALARLRRRMLGVEPAPRTVIEPPTRVATRAGVEALRPATAIGAYRLLHPIGQGGMGEVWLAHDPRLDRKVAIKVLQPHVARDLARARLVREAQAIAQIGHPNVVAVYDTGTIGDGDSPAPRAYIAMEYVAGCSLAAWLRAAPRTQAEIVAVFVAAGLGLVAAHRVGQVHRDFKPANVMIGPHGEVKVLDFGIAMSDSESPSGASGDTDISPRLRASGDTGRLTETGVVLGTPRYMSPEQHTGGVVTATSDQFSFCCALLEALQNGPVFVGRGAVQLARAKLCGAIARGPTAVPTRLRAVLGRGLECDPEQRWPSLAVLLDQLTRRRSRRPLAALVAGVAGLAAIAAVAAAESRCAARPVISDANAAEILAQYADGHTSAARLVTTLREHDNRLGDLDVETCVAHHDGEIDDDAFDRRAECLREHRRDLEHAAELLASGDVLGASASMVAGGLTDAGACAEDARLALAIAPPADVATARAVDRARSHLSAARARRLGGLPREALAAVDAARAAAATIDYAPLTAELDFATGQIQLAVADPAAADTLERALAVAESIGHERLAAEIAASLVGAAVRQPASLERLPTILRRADAIILRAGDPATARGDYWMAVSSLHTKRGEFAQSLTAAERGEAAYATTLAPDDRRRDSAAFNIGIALINLHRFDEGVARLAYVAAARERSLGPTHPSTIAALAVLGVGHAQANDLDHADARLHDAVERAESAFGSLHPELPFALGALGDVASRRDRLDDARAYYRRALAIAEHNEGPLAAETATLAAELGEIERRSGRLDDARIHLAQAIAGHEHMLGHEHALVAQAYRTMAEVEILADEPDDARAHALEAIAILEALAATPEQLALARRPLDAAELALAGR